MSATTWDVWRRPVVIWKIGHAAAVARGESGLMARAVRRHSIVDIDADDLTVFVRGHVWRLYSDDGRHSKKLREGRA